MKYGELLFYYPIKFETSLSFEDLCEKIAESSVFFSDAYQERVLNAMGHSLANMVEEWNEKPSDENLMLLKMQDFERYHSLEGDDDEIFRGNIRLEIEATEGSFKTHLVNTELEAMQEHVERIKSAEEISRRIYGNRYVNSQDRFLLLPLKVELNNGKEGWLYAVLYVFSNKMGVLKLELPVVDVDTSLLKEANPDRYIQKVSNALAANLQTNTEFALLIILLKKMNQSNDYVKKKMIPGELTKIRKEYRENLIFICELQEGCYGSVSEQTETFEKMMPYYMKQEITDTKLAAIDGMLEDEKKQRIEKFQDFLAVGGSQSFHGFEACPPSDFKFQLRMNFPEMRQKRKICVLEGKILHILYNKSILEQKSVKSCKNLFQKGREILI